MRRFLILFLFLIASHVSFAHGFGGSGFLHPLTGLDHLLAMIAVGVWSAQLGGKSIYLVPMSFLAMMLLGGIIGIKNISIGYVELMISLSVVFLGFTIAINKKVALLFAAIAVALFGFSHGYSHGLEINNTLNTAEYIIGFLVTTFGLHIVGASKGLLLLEKTNGQKHLRFFGAITFAIGICLLFNLALV